MHGPQPRASWWLWRCERSLIALLLRSTDEFWMSGYTSPGDKHIYLIIPVTGAKCSTSRLKIESFFWNFNYLEWWNRDDFVHGQTDKVEEEIWLRTTAATISWCNQWCQQPEFTGWKMDASTVNLICTLIKSHSDCYVLICTCVASLRADDGGGAQSFYCNWQKKTPGDF